MHLVPNANVVDGQAIDGLGSLDPVGDVSTHVRDTHKHTSNHKNNSNKNNNKTIVVNTAAVGKARAYVDVRLG